MPAFLTALLLAHTQQVNLTDMTLNRDNVGVGQAISKLTFAATGGLSTAGSAGTSSGIGPDSNNWYLGNPSPGIGSSYELRATLNSGSLDSGTTGSWIDLSTAPAYEVNDDTGVGQTANLTIEIRPAGGSGVIASCTTILYAIGT